MKKYIIAIVAVGCWILAGCDVKDSKQSVDSNGVPITPSESTAPVVPAPAPNADQAPKPQAVSEVNKETIEKLTHQPSSKNDAAIANVENAAKEGRVVSLDSLRKASQNNQAVSEDLNALSSDAPADAAADKAAAAQDGSLEPYPSAQAEGVSDYQDDWTEDAVDEDSAMPDPIDGATVNPDDQAEPNTAPQQDMNSPWPSEKVDNKLTKDAAKLARDDIRAIVTSPDTPRERIQGVGKTRDVTGATVQVNNAYISSDEIVTSLARQLSEIPQNLGDEDYAKKADEIIHNETMYLIQQNLVYDEAEKSLEENVKQYIEKEIQDTLSDMKNLSGGSMERLRAKCRREGTTLDDLLKMQRRELTVQIYLQSKFMPAIVVTRRMLWNFYRDHPDMYRTDKRVQMQIIAAPFDKFLPDNVDKPTSEEKEIAKRAAERHIENAYRMLISGSDFDKIAMEMSRGPMASKGGIWPVMVKGNFREAAVEETAFKLPNGRYSNIIETDSGYYIVRARKIYPGKRISFEQAQEGIENAADPAKSIAPIEEILRRDQFVKLRTEYMTNVYKQATIIIPDNFYVETLRQAMLRYRPNLGMGR